MVATSAAAAMKDFIVIDLTVWKGSKNRFQTRKNMDERATIADS